MSDKSLKDKAIKIQNKDYVLVSDRIIFFNNEYKNGCIKTYLLSNIEDNKIVMQAKVWPDAQNEKRYFTGFSQEVIGQGFINKTSALENAETSAVGRALAMMGIGVIDSIASVDEINKSKNQIANQYKPTTQYKPKQNATNLLWLKIKKEIPNITETITKDQIEKVKNLISNKAGIQLKNVPFSEAEAKQILEYWT